MPAKKANSQAAWALITEGVTAARLEAHRLQHLVNRATQLVDGSTRKDHLYEVAGDIIVGLPDRLDHLINDLDRTSLALSRMGQDFLESRLSFADKNLVEEAISSAFGKARPKESVAQRVAQRYLGTVESDKLNLVEVWTPSLDKLAVGFDFSDAEDRASFRQSVQGAFSNAKIFVVKVLLDHYLPQRKKTTSGQRMIRQLADFWMTRQ